MKLKFRAWHKESKKYLNVVSSVDFDNKEIWVNENGYASVYLFSEIILEQYTGVVDSNKIEICVNDIVQLNLKFKSKIDNGLRVVKILDGGYRLLEFDKQTGKVSDWHDNNILCEYEVFDLRITKVGNINENGDLLK